MNAMTEEIKRLVEDVLAEAKKKKEKAVELKHDPKPSAYGYAEAFDFSAPLGAYNLYRTQGAVNWGPMTGPGTKIDDRIVGQKAGLESVLKGIVTEALQPSAWDVLAESVKPATVPTNVWEAANHWYDHMSFGLGRATAESIEKKKGVAAKKLAKKAGKK